MDLRNFTLGKRTEDERYICIGNDSNNVAAEILFFELGLAFRPMPRWGPSALDILIPYGAPVYRQSERPLSGLAMYSIYDWRSKKCSESPIKKMLIQTGLWKVFEELSRQELGFYEARLLAGQSVNETLSPTGRQSIVVNDCIHLNIDKLEHRLLLIDLSFKMSEDAGLDWCKEVKRFIHECIRDSKILRFSSIEWRRIEKGSILDETYWKLHVFLTVDLDRGFYEERPGWITCCHNLYYKSFMSTESDAADERTRLLYAMWGGLDMVGEYDWNRQLVEIVPLKNKAYDEACQTFRDAKSAISRLQRLGQRPDFVTLMQNYNQPKSEPHREITRADILEGIVMGWW